MAHLSCVFAVARANKKTLGPIVPKLHMLPSSKLLMDETTSKDFTSDQLRTTWMTPCC